MNDLAARDAVEEERLKIDALYEDAEDVLRRKERRLTENMAFFRGYQHGVARDGGLFETYPNLDPRVEAEVYNYIQRAVRTDVARAFKAPLNFAVASADASSIGRLRARNTQTLARSLVRTNVIDIDELVDARSAAAIHGAAWLKVFWNPYKGKPAPGASPPFEGEVDVQFCSILDVLPDPRAASMREVRYIFHRRYIPLSTCEDMWPEDIFGESTAGRFQARGQREHWEDVNLESRSMNIAADPNELCEVIDYWELPTNKFPDGRLIVYSGGTVLAFDVLPYECPFVLIYGSNKAPGILYPDGLIHNLKPIQRSINLAASKAREAVNIALNPPLLVDLNSGISGDRFSNIVGEVIKYNPGSREPRWMEPPNIASALEGYLSTLNQTFSDVSAFSDVAGGKAPAPGTSARAIAYMAELNESVHATEDTRFRKTLLEMTTKGLKLIRVFYAEGRLVKLMGAANDVAVRAFKAEDYDFDADLVIDPYSQQPTSPAVRRAEISEYFQQGLFADDPAAMAARRLMEIDADNGSTADVKAAHRRRAEEEQVGFLLLARGEQVDPRSLAVLPQDNDDIHLEEHEHFAVTEWLTLPPELQQAFMQHLEEHEAQRAGKLQVVAGEQQALAGNGAGPDGNAPPAKGQPQGAAPPEQRGVESPLDGGQSPLPETTATAPSVYE